MAFKKIVSAEKLKELLEPFQRGTGENTSQGALCSLPWPCDSAQGLSWGMLSSTVLHYPPTCCRVRVFIP